MNRLNDHSQKLALDVCFGSIAALHYRLLPTHSCLSYRAACCQRLLPKSWFRKGDSFERWSGLSYSRVRANRPPSCSGRQFAKHLPSNELQRGGTVRRSSTHQCPGAHASVLNALQLGNCQVNRRSIGRRRGSVTTHCFQVLNRKGSKLPGHGFILDRKSFFVAKQLKARNGL